MKNHKLHVISTGRQKPEQFAEIAGMIHPYIDAIHIREKARTAKEIYDVVTLLTDNKIPLSKIVINDRVDVAYVTKAAGVQLAGHSLPVDRVKNQFPGLNVGCSVHSIEEAQMAEEKGADYVVFGHIYPTQSKPDLTPRGLEALKRLTDSVSIPVIAIGGIKPSNISDVNKAGASGIAVMSGILEAEDPLEAVKQYAARLSL